MARKETVLLGLLTEQAHKPGYAVCYARGTFKKEGRLHRVERGKRTLVNRALCVTQHYGAKCKQCPHHKFVAAFEAP